MPYQLKEATHMLGISMSTARRWIKSEKMKATLQEGVHGPEYVVDQEEVLRLLAETKPDSPESFLIARMDDLESKFVAMQTRVCSDLEALKKSMEQVITHNMQVIQKMDENNLRISQMTALAKSETGSNLQHFRSELDKIIANQVILGKNQVDTKNFINEKFYDIQGRLQVTVEENRKLSLLDRLRGKE